MTTHTDFRNSTLTVRRTFDAAKADVFDAWMDAAKTTHWWGCSQTSKVSSTIDVQQGGQYRHLMTIDGVGEYLIDGTIVEFDPPDLLAYTVPGFDGGDSMLVRVAFEAAGDQTQVTLTQSALPEGLRDAVGAGWTASFERLAGLFNGMRRAA